MPNETSKISELDSATRIKENALIPVVNTNTETNNIDLSTLRSALWFENAYVDIASGLVGTEKGESFFVYEDENKAAVLGWMNQGGDSYSPLLDGVGIQVKFTTPGTMADLYNDRNAYHKLFVYAEAEGVVNDSSVDSSDALQALVDKYKGIRIILPPSIMIKKTIKYYTQTIISGIAETRSVIWAGSNFVGTAMFEPATKTKQSVQEPDFSNLTLADQSATNANRGTTSTINGIELVGTFVAKVENVKGVRLNATVHCDVGTEVQHTMRPYLRRINGSNVNWHILFEPTSDDRFAYGDIYLSDIKTSASCMNGIRIRDTDGLQINGAVIFPNGGIEVSGHYLNISNVHPFEPKSVLADTRIPACITILPRGENTASRFINIANVACGFAGRLADTTSGNPAQTNNPAPAIYMKNCLNFNIHFTVNQSAQGALKLIDCQTGIFSFSSLDVNTQALGSGKLTPGTFDTVSLENCQYITGSFTDNSPSRRYAIYFDDNCYNNAITAVSARGYVLGQNVRNTTNGNFNYAKVVAQNGTGTTSTTVYEAKKSGPTILTVSDGSATPSTPNVSNNDVVKLNNSVVTNITDFPDIGNYQSITVVIGDNNASRLVDVANGGKFSLGGSNVMGRGTVLRLFRDDMSGNLIKY